MFHCLFQHMNQLKGPHSCVAATLVHLSGNEDAVASCSPRSSKLDANIPPAEFETGNYCLSCSFFPISERRDQTHRHTPGVEITLRSASFHTQDPRFKVLTHLWPAFSSANRAEMVAKMRRGGGTDAGGGVASECGACCQGWIDSG